MWHEKEWTLTIVMNYILVRSMKFVFLKKWGNPLQKLLTKEVSDVQTCANKCGQSCLCHDLFSSKQYCMHLLILQTRMNYADDDDPYMG